MKLEDRVVQRTAELLLARILADEGKPDAKPPQLAVDRDLVDRPRSTALEPQVDEDGDFRCAEHPDKAFISERAFRWHRSRVHGEKGGRP